MNKSDITTLNITTLNAEELKTAANKLRTEYRLWKNKHPVQQNEDFINKFLMIKAALKKMNQDLSQKDDILDAEATALEHIAKIKIIPVVPESISFDDTYAPVSSSGNGNDELIKFNQVEPYFKDFLISDSLVSLVGGIVTHEKDGTKNDIDTLINIPTQEELKRIILFRLSRMLPEKLKDRFSPLVESKRGTSPFTDYYPLYRLKLERIPDSNISKMSDSFADLKLRAKSSGDKVIAQANKAKNEDKITFGEFFLPQKPCRGYKSDQEQTVENFLSLWKDNQFPVYSSKKADGLNILFMISKSGKSLAFTEDGVDETSSFPEVLEEAKKLAPNHDIIVLAEVEWWEGKQHYPREVAAGKIHKVKPDEQGIIVNVYDLVYYDKDIHNESFEKRLEITDKLKFPQKTETPNVKYKWNLLPNIKNDTIGELKNETERLRKVISSEGNVAKQGSASYDLAGKRAISWIKFHNATTFVALCLNSIETKTQGIYNIEWGVLPGERKIKESDSKISSRHTVIYGGKTFTTTKQPTVGSKILIECETFNVIYDKRNKTFSISAWAPRFFGVTDKKLQTIEEIEKQAIKDHVFQAKVIDEKGKTHYLPGVSGEEVESKE